MIFLVITLIWKQFMDQGTGTSAAQVSDVGLVLFI